MRKKGREAKAGEGIYSRQPSHKFSMVLLFVRCVSWITLQIANRASLSSRSDSGDRSIRDIVTWWKNSSVLTRSKVNVSHCRDLSGISWWRCKQYRYSRSWSHDRVDHPFERDGFPSATFTWRTACWSEGESRFSALFAVTCLRLDLKITKDSYI